MAEQSKLWIHTHEFWKSACEEHFKARYKQLMQRGMTGKEASDFLEEIYNMVGGEYGA